MNDERKEERMQDSRTDKLGNAPILKLLVEFSVPAIVGMLVNAIYNIVDRMFVGNMVGENGLAALTFSFPLMTLVFAVATLVGQGGTSLIAISLGEQKKERAEIMTNNVFVLVIALEFIMMVAGLIFMKPLLRLFGTTEGVVMDMASAYMQIIYFGAIFQGISFSLSSILRAEGNPRASMTTMLIGAGVNILLDWLLTVGIKMGVRGAAIATIAGQFASMLWTLYYFLGKRSELRIKPKYFKPVWSYIKRILVLGIAPALVQAIMALINIVYNNSLSYYGELDPTVSSGTIAVAAYSVFNSAMTLAIMPVLGLNQGVQPIVSYNYGARKFERGRRALLYGMIGATIILAAAFAVIHIFPEQIVRAFNDSEDLIKVGSMALKINTMFLPIVGVQILAANYFQYIGKARPAMILNMLRQCLFLIPALLILPRIWQLQGVFYAQPLCDVLSTVVSVAWLMVELRRNMKEEHELKAREASSE